MKKQKVDFLNLDNTLLRTLRKRQQQKQNTKAQILWVNVVWSFMCLIIPTILTIQNEVFGLLFLITIFMVKTKFYHLNRDVVL